MQKNVLDFINYVCYQNQIEIPLCYGMSCVFFILLRNIQSMFIFYKFNDATNLQLKQKQVFESKLTQVLQKWGKNDNESLSRSTLNLYLPNVSKHDYIK